VASHYATNAAWDAWNDSDGTSTNDATVWSYWNRMTITADAGDNYVWYHWNTDQTVGTNDYDYENANIIWGQWNVEVTPSVTPTVVAAPKRAKNESRRAIRRKHAELKRKLKENRKLRIAAEEKRRAESKAQELLFDLIGEVQAKLFKDTGRLLVKGNEFDWLISKSGIGDGAHVRIQKVKKDKIIDLCVRVNDQVPPSDRVITFALRSKYDEEAFEKTANVTRVNENQKLPECANF
jgi:hypothetical protein